jgi:hypothetical protein
MEAFSMLIIFMVLLSFIAYYCAFKLSKRGTIDNEQLEEKLLLDIYVYGKSIKDCPLFDSKQTLATGFPTLVTTIEERDDKFDLAEEATRRC